MIVTSTAAAATACTSISTSTTPTPARVMVERSSKRRQGRDGGRDAVRCAAATVGQQDHGDAAVEILDDRVREAARLAAVRRAQSVFGAVQEPAEAVARWRPVV